MLSRLARRYTSSVVHPVISLLIRVRITPNELTVAALALSGVCGVFIAVNQLIPAAAALALVGLLDALDGELARAIQRASATGQPNPMGAFIDSVADHYGDFAIYFGLAWRAIRQNDSLNVCLVIAAMFGSVVGSHIRSRAGMIGIDTKNVGMFTRAERILVLLVGLISGWIAPALGVLAVVNNVSAVQRVVYVLRGKRKSE